MSKELDKARQAAERAVRSLANIAALPQNVGDQVRWTHNGCVWTRKGDDEWVAAEGAHHTYPAEHVATFEYEHLSRPTPEPLTEKNVLRVQVTLAAEDVIVGDIIDMMMDSSEVLEARPRNGGSQMEFKLAGYSENWLVVPQGSKLQVRRGVPVR